MVVFLGSSGGGMVEVEGQAAAQSSSSDQAVVAWLGLAEAQVMVVWSRLRAMHDGAVRA
jgi:hypothetical protein